jgi:hypothetical protein
VSPVRYELGFLSQETKFFSFPVVTFPHYFSPDSLFCFSIISKNILKVIFSVNFLTLCRSMSNIKMDLE